MVVTRIGRPSENPQAAAEKISISQAEATANPFPSNSLCSIAYDLGYIDANAQWIKDVEKFPPALTSEEAKAIFSSLDFDIVPKPKQLKELSSFKQNLFKEYAVEGELRVEAKISVKELLRHVCKSAGPLIKRVVVFGGAVSSLAGGGYYKRAFSSLSLQFIPFLEVPLKKIERERVEDYDLVFEVPEAEDLESLAEHAVEFVSSHYKNGAHLNFVREAAFSNYDTVCSSETHYFIVSLSDGRGRAVDLIFMKRYQQNGGLFKSRSLKLDISPLFIAGYGGKVTVGSSEFKGWAALFGRLSKTLILEDGFYLGNSWPKMVALMTRGESCPKREDMERLEQWLKGKDADAIVGALAEAAHIYERHPVIEMLPLMLNASHCLNFSFSERLWEPFFRRFWADIARADKTNGEKILFLLGKALYEKKLSLEDLSTVLQLAAYIELYWGSSPIVSEVKNHGKMMAALTFEGKYTLHLPLAEKKAFQDFNKIGDREAACSLLKLLLPSENSVKKGKAVHFIDSIDMAFDPEQGEKATFTGLITLLSARGKEEEVFDHFIHYLSFKPDVKLSGMLRQRVRACTGAVLKEGSNSPSAILEDLCRSKKRELLEAAFAIWRRSKEKDMAVGELIARESLTLFPPAAAELYAEYSFSLEEGEFQILCAGISPCRQWVQRTWRPLFYLGKQFSVDLSWFVEEMLLMNEIEAASELFFLQLKKKAISHKEKAQKLWIGCCSQEDLSLASANWKQGEQLGLYEPKKHGEAYAPLLVSFLERAYRAALWDEGDYFLKRIEEVEIGGLIGRFDEAMKMRLSKCPLPVKEVALIDPGMFPAYYAGLIASDDLKTAVKYALEALDKYSLKDLFSPIEGLLSRLHKEGSSWAEEQAVLIFTHRKFSEAFPLELLDPWLEKKNAPRKLLALAFQKTGKIGPVFACKILDYLDRAQLKRGSFEAQIENRLAEFFPVLSLEQKVRLLRLADYHKLKGEIFPETAEELFSEGIRQRDEKILFSSYLKDCRSGIFEKSAWIPALFKLAESSPQKKRWAEQIFASRNPVWKEYLLKLIDSSSELLTEEVLTRFEEKYRFSATVQWDSLYQFFLSIKDYAEALRIAENKVPVRLRELAALPQAENSLLKYLKRTPFSELHLIFAENIAERGSGHAKEFMDWAIDSGSLSKIPVPVLEKLFLKQVADINDEELGFYFALYQSLGLPMNFEWAARLMRSENPEFREAALTFAESAENFEKIKKLAEDCGSPCELFQRLRLKRGNLRALLPLYLYYAKNPPDHLLGELALWTQALLKDLDFEEKRFSQTLRVFLEHLISKGKAGDIITAMYYSWQRVLDESSVGRIMGRWILRRLREADDLDNEEFGSPYGDFYEYISQIKKCPKIYRECFSALLDVAVNDYCLGFKSSERLEAILPDARKFPVLYFNFYKRLYEKTMTDGILSDDPLMAIKEFKDALSGIYTLLNLYSDKRGELIPVLIKALYSPSLYLHGAIFDQCIRAWRTLHEGNINLFLGFPKWQTEINVMLNQDFHPRLTILDKVLESLLELKRPIAVHQALTILVNLKGMFRGQAKELSKRLLNVLRVFKEFPAVEIATSSITFNDVLEKMGVLKNLGPQIRKYKIDPQFLEKNTTVEYYPLFRVVLEGLKERSDENPPRTILDDRTPEGRMESVTVLGEYCQIIFPLCKNQNMSGRVFNELSATTNDVLRIMMAYTQFEMFMDVMVRQYLEAGIFWALRLAESGDYSPMNEIDNLLFLNCDTGQFNEREKKIQASVVKEWIEKVIELGTRPLLEEVKKTLTKAINKGLFCKKMSLKILMRLAGQIKTLEKPSVSK